jgi:hypothetical protein
VNLFSPWQNPLIFATTVALSANASAAGFLPSLWRQEWEGGDPPFPGGGGVGGGDGDGGGNGNDVAVVVAVALAVAVAVEVGVALCGRSRSHGDYGCSGDGSCGGSCSG